MRVRFLLGLVALGVFGGGSGTARAEAPCYVAFIHGSGDKFQHDPEASAEIERYFSPDGSAARSFVHHAARQGGPGACALWRVGYDGNQQWWHPDAAGRVAASLYEFITREGIPDGRLVLVGHSMGGVVARYVVNNGMPASPYYNEYAWLDPRMDYDLVRRKTSHILSVQAPHAGAQAADALYGEADHRLTNGSATLVRVLGFHDATNATAVMTRAYMEAAGASGGEMGDEARVVPLCTIGGVTTEERSGLGDGNDSNLARAWTLLCYRRGALNSWGAGCRWDVWNFEETPGDGLVELASAHGLWLRGRANGRAGIAGALVRWLDVDHNHNQSRYNALAARVVDHLTGKSGLFLLGSFLGTNGLGLPGAGP
jgi:hypothetical protein